MKNIKSKFALMLAAVLLLITINPSTAFAEELYEQAMKATDEYLETHATDEAWAVFAKGRNLEADHTDDYYVNFYENLDTDALASGIYTNNAGTYAKTLLALRAMGRGDSEKAQAIESRLKDTTWVSTTVNAYSAPAVI